MDVSASRLSTVQGAGLTQIQPQPPTLQTIRSQIAALKQRAGSSQGAVVAQLEALEIAIVQRLGEAEAKAITDRKPIDESVRNQFFCEIQAELISIAEHGCNPKEIEKLAYDIKGCSFHAVVGKIQSIAAGKSKEILVRSILGRHVYSAPKVSKGVLGRIQTARRRAELKGEFELGERMIDGFVKSGSGRTAEEAKENLSLGFELVGEEERIRGDFTLKSERAAGDLERKFSPLDFGYKDPKHFDPDLLSFGGQILKGFRDLHAAGYVQGDPKLENCLFYPLERAGRQVKLADFGKAQKLGRGETVVYAGNPRYAAPEGSLSQKSEVFAAGEMLVRTLESHFLTPEHRVLVEPKEVKTQRSSRSTERVGIEGFLVKNRQCPQTESLGLVGRVSVLAQRFGRAVVSCVSPKSAETRPSDAAFRREVEQYVGVLMEKLAGNDPEPDAVALIDLKNLLMAMLDPNPAKRPTMETAYKEYQRIAEHLFPQGTSPEVSQAGV